MAGNDTADRGGASLQAHGTGAGGGHLAPGEPGMIGDGGYPGIGAITPDKKPSGGPRIRYVRSM